MKYGFIDNKLMKIDKVVDTVIGEKETGEQIDGQYGTPLTYDLLDKDIYAASEMQRLILNSCNEVNDAITESERLVNMTIRQFQNEYAHLIVKYNGGCLPEKLEFIEYQLGWTDLDPIHQEIAILVTRPFLMRDPVRYIKDSLEENRDPFTWSPNESPEESFGHHNLSKSNDLTASEKEIRIINIVDSFPSNIVEAPSYPVDPNLVTDEQ